MSEMGLFGELVDAFVPIARHEKIEWMQMEHGFREGKTCRTCSHLQYDKYHSKTYLKCDLFGESRGEGTDWKASFPACGKWNEQPLTTSDGEVNWAVFGERHAI